MMVALSKSTGRIFRLGAIAVAAWGLNGCAYLTTYTRAVDFDTSSYAMDVKQRVVLSKTRQANGPRIVCAEPSPDALTTITASAGAEVAATVAAGAATSRNSGQEQASEDASAQNRAQTNLAAALSEQGAFVGLRTQSIQLLRDAMYRLCEGYASGAVTESEFAAMQKRYQSTMLGLLAIEQLTRPVVAAQVALVSSASAASGQTADDARVTALEEKLDLLDEKVGRQEDAVSQARVVHQAAVEAKVRNRQDAQKARATASDEERKRQSTEKEQPDQKKVDAKADEAAKTFDEVLPGLTAEEKEKETALETARRDLAVTMKQRARAADALFKAQGRASASAMGGAQFGAIGNATASMTETMAKEVKGIVREVNESYLLSDCVDFLKSRAARQADSEARISRLSASIAGLKTNGLDNVKERNVLQAQLETERQSMRAESGILETCANALNPRKS